MPCYHPLPGWYGRYKTDAGKRPVVFSSADAWSDLQLEIPCGRCIGCRLERSRQWAIRCMHEASLHEHNSFATLTYDQDNIPKGGTLNPQHFVLFMKRLRKAHGPGVRFFQCGEYGERTERPHHHALLFNFAVPDRRPYPGTPGLYTSAHLDGLWTHGATTLGPVNFDTAAYVARYSLKKVTGPMADDHYHGRVPEYATMSRRPGIGNAWLQRFASDVYPDDAVTLRGGIKCRPPKYYDSHAGPLVGRRLLRRLKARRTYAQRDNPDNTGRRLVVREKAKTALLALLKRDLP